MKHGWKKKAPLQVLSWAPSISGNLNKRGEIPLSRNLSGQAWQALADAAMALHTVARAMAGENVSLPVSHALSPAGGVTVAEMINDFLIAKARAGKSDRYIRALKNSLSKFCRARSRQPLDAITTQEIENWLADSDWAPRTRKGYLLDVRTLYNFAVRRGYCAGNPANAVECPQPGASQIGIHAPEEVARILELARGHNLNIMRALALRYFAGLRASEAALLQETEIRREQGLIEVTAAKSKTRRRRLVEIQPVLNAWLDVGGSLPLHDVDNRMRLFVKIVNAEGIPWPVNAPRHSFCSYHLAAFESASKTALAAGHSEQMLFQHYRALVTKQEALKFWRCIPSRNAGAGVPRCASELALGSVTELVPPRIEPSLVGEPALENIGGNKEAGLFAVSGVPLNPEGHAPKANHVL